MADANAEEVSSPTTLVMRYLQSKGVSPNMKNYGAQVRAALLANAKDPTLIPGLRNDTPATEADDQAAMRAAGKGGSRSGGGRSGRSTLPVDLGHGPTNEADWQPTTTSAPPAAQDVLAMQNATNPAMRAAVPDIPPPPVAPQAATPPEVSPPPSTTPWGTPSPWGSPPAPRDLDAALTEATAPRTPPPTPEVPSPAPAPSGSGLQIENIPRPPPDFTIQAPPADSIPPSGGLNVEDRMMPGRGNLTIQAPSAGSMPPTQAPVIQETAPSFRRMLGGAATGAGVGRIMGPGGMALGAVLGAAPEAWNLGKQIIGR